MGTLDIYGPDFPAHGSLAGYDAGCRTNPVCTNFGSEQLLTCKEAWMARGEYDRPKVAYDAPARRIAPGPVSPARAMEMAMAVPPKKTAPASAPAPSAASDPAPAQEPKPLPGPPPEKTEPIEPPPTAGFETFKKTRGPYLPRDLAFDDERYPHGTEKGYKRGCRTEEDCNKNRIHETTTGTCLAAHQATFKRQPAAADEPLDADVPALLEQLPPAADLPPLGGLPAQGTTLEDAAEAALEEITAQITARDLAIAAELSDDTRLETTLAAEEIAEMCLVCHDTGPVNFTCQCGRTDSHHPVASSTHDANGEPLEDTAPDEQIDYSEEASRIQLEQNLVETRSELALAEQAGRTLATDKARLEHDVVELKATITQLNVDLADSRATSATAQRELTQTREANAALLERIEATTGGGIATIPIQQPHSAPLTPQEDLGLTIEPTPANGVRISLTAGTRETLHINLALAASDRPGLGDLAIAVGGSRDEQR